MTLVKFENILVEENGEALVDLSLYDFLLEPMYFKMGLAEDSRMFLRKGVAESLATIQKGLQGYKLKIWDGFRSRQVQKAIYDKFWNELKEKNPDWDEVRLKEEVGVFVTIPNKPGRIPPHATGAAVDLTLVASDGAELDMGTVFDHFGPEAAPMYFDETYGDKAIIDNRRILREAMLGAGFAGDGDEWWHFDLGSQKWAAELGKESAFYGEADTPVFER